MFLEKANFKCEIWLLLFNRFILVLFFMSSSILSIDANDSLVFARFELIYCKLLLPEILKVVDQGLLTVFFLGLNHPWTAFVGLEDFQWRMCFLSCDFFITSIDRSVMLIFNKLLNASVYSSPASNTRLLLNLHSSLVPLLPLDLKVSLNSRLSGSEFIYHLLGSRKWTVDDPRMIFYFCKTISVERIWANHSHKEILQLW